MTQIPKGSSLGRRVERFRDRLQAMTGSLSASVEDAINEFALGCYADGRRSVPPPIPMDARGLVKDEPIARDSQKPTPIANKRKVRG